MTVRQNSIEADKQKSRILPAAGVCLASGPKAVGQHSAAKEAHQHGALGVNKNGQARHDLAQFRPGRHGNLYDPI